MDNELNAIEVLDQLEVIVQSAAEEIVVESRLEETLEIYESIRYEQELINFIDRLRNTEGEIQVTMACKNYPLITGEIRFTSDEYLVLSNSQADYFIASKHICLINNADPKAIFRMDTLPIETTMLWIKNLIDAQSLVSVTLLGDIQLVGTIIRFGHDHLDFVAASKYFVIPMSAIVVIRSNHAPVN